MTGMRYFGFLLGKWPIFLLAFLMSGLGYGLYEWLEPVERWRLAIDVRADQLLAVSPDGRFLFGSSDVSKSPVFKRDIATSAVVAEFPAKSGGYESPWGQVDFEFRYIYGLPIKNRNVLELFDLNSGAISRIPIDDVAVNKPYFAERHVLASPRENVAAIYHYEKKRTQPSIAMDEIRKAEIHLHALPSGERIGRVVVLADPPNQEAELLKRTGQEYPKFESAKFSPDGSYFIVPCGDNGDRSYLLWDLQQRKAAGTIPVEAWGLQLSPDGRCLLTTQADTTKKIWNVTDLAKPVAVGILPCTIDGFSPDSRTLVAILKAEVVFWDSATGKELGRTALPSEGHHFDFSHDSTLIAVQNQLSPNNHFLCVLDVATRTVLWSVPTSTVHVSGTKSKTNFDMADQTYLIVGGSGMNRSIELRQARTGELQARFPFRRNTIQDGDLFGNGNQVVVNANTLRGNDEPQIWFLKWVNELLNRDRPEHFSDVRVIDLPTRRSMLRIKESHEVHGFVFSDGTKLLTVHAFSEEPHIRCYDLPARHPWWKIVGIPMGLGVLCLVAARWWKWRRDKWVRKATPVALAEGALTAGWSLGTLILARFRRSL